MTKARAIFLLVIGGAIGFSASYLLSRREIKDEETELAEMMRMHEVQRLNIQSARACASLTVNSTLRLMEKDSTFVYKGRISNDSTKRLLVESYICLQEAQQILYEYAEIYKIDSALFKKYVDN